MTVPPPLAEGDESDVFVLPASFGQQRLWFIEQLEPGRATYNVPLNLRLTGRLDTRALERALSWLVERHETLRTVFDAPSGEVAQVILPPDNISLPVEDLSSLARDEREHALAARIHEEGTKPFSLANGPVFRATLIRLAAEEHALLITAHHIAVDGWSLTVLQRELSAAYDAFKRGAEPQAAELPIQYADYAGWQRDLLGGGELAGQVDYWVKRLAPPLPVLDLPTDHPRSAIRDRTAQAVTLEVPLDVTEGLIALGRHAGATSFATMLAAYQVLLHRYTGQEDIVVGSPVAGRSKRETEGLIGLFVNTLAIRTDLSGAPSFRAVLQRVRDNVHGALANQDVPFERIVDAVQPERDRSRNPVFQTLFSLQDFTAGSPLTLSGLTVARIGGARSTAKFDIQLIMNQRPGGFRGSLEYDATLFDEASMQRLMRNFVILLRAIVAEPDRAVAELPLLDDEERETVLHRWNDAVLEYPHDATMHGMVAAQAARTPDAVALVHNGSEVSYAELDRRAEALATRLQALGVGREVRVGVCLSRTPQLIVALLAVLKAGGTYAPLDPAYPPDRNAYILADSGAIVVLTESAYAESLGSSGVPLMLLDAPPTTEAPAPARRDEADSRSVAYLIYTSGSTGRPKGVAIEHRNAVALIAWAHTVFSAEELAGVLFSTSVCFDLSIFEMFVPLTRGGSIIIADNALALPTLADANRVTLVNTVPSAIAALLRGGPLPRSVQTVNLAGEPLSTAIVAQLYALRTVRRVYDLYGPSEDTTYSTFALRHPHEPPTIGRAIANTQAYVLDAQRQPVPLGVPGELYLGGDGVARGYHMRPELTAERFLVDPFSANADARMYRTGDRVRWRADGNLEYLGRLDHQVKIRGFRIEPGEVQTVLEAVPGVREAAVIVRDDARGDKRLLGYYAVKAGAELSPADVRAALAKVLPEYMVPSVITPLAALPLTPNGKLDRAALPEPGAIEATDGYAPPRTLIEHELVQNWSALFPGKRIGIRDNFFEIGGHSLLAIQMLFEIERVRGRRVPLALLFEMGTIEQLAAWLTGEVRADGEPPVVVLQPEAPATPFAFVHGDVRGGGWYCRRLAPLAAADSPWFVLPTIGIDGDTQALTIESMAATHVTELRKKQPVGPYRVGGFCVGGLIAFEMARQLEAAGQEVERLVIIDAAAVNVRVRAMRPLLAFISGRDANERLTRQALAMQKLRYYTNRLVQAKGRSAGGQVEWVTTNVSRRLKRLTSSAGAASTKAPRNTLAHDSNTSALAGAMRTEIAAGPGAAVLLMQSRAASVYVPRHFGGTIDLIWADERANIRPADPTRGWKTFASKVRVHPIVSSHLGLVTSDLPALAAAIAAALGAKA